MVAHANMNVDLDSRTEGNHTNASIEAPVTDSLGGMHRCYLSEPMHLDSMSPDFCAFTGYTIDDLVYDDGYARYSRMLHPDDVTKYNEYCESLADREGRATISYRLVKKNGDVVEITDTMVSRRDRQGVMWGLAIAVPSDGNDARSYARNDGSDSDEYGTVCLEWEDVEGIKPRITDCNDYFLNLAGIADDVIKRDRAAAVVTVNLLLADQVYSFIPDFASVSSRPTFYSQPFLKRLDGSYVELSCWGKLRSQKTGTTCKLTLESVSQKAYEDRVRNKLVLLDEMSALYDLVFDLNLRKGTVRCVHDSIGVAPFNSSCEIPLEMHGAIAEWTNRYLEEDSRRRFIADTAPLFGMGPRQGIHMVSRSYTALVHGRETPANLFACRFGGALVIGARIVDRPANSPLVSHRVQIRTFGFFEVFVDGAPLIFKHPKSRELFAILVDRRGGVVTSRVAASILWDDKEPDATVMARFRKIAMYLTETLEGAGVGWLVENTWGSRRAVLSMAECDLTDYLSQDGEAASPFNGAYMKEYSWAEETLGELVFRAEKLAKAEAKSK